MSRNIQHKSVGCFPWICGLLILEKLLLSTQMPTVFYDLYLQ